jgi:glycosyltransferase involved in cell wall biosynthesis
MMSLVLPCHNEENFLPYSLPSIKRAPIDELVVVLDRCTDRTEQLIDSVDFPFPVKKVVKTEQKWHSPTAEVFELGFKNSSGDLLFSTAGDMILDPIQFDPALFKDADFLCFFYYNRDLQRYKIRQWYENFLKRYLPLAQLWRGVLGRQSGHMAFTRECWEKIHVRDQPSEYDDFQRRALAEGFRYKWCGFTKNVHLRAGLSKDRQELQGMSRALRKVHPALVFGHALLHMKPHVFTGYLQERSQNLFKQQVWKKDGH